MSNQNYNFIPWVRYGVGNYISAADNPLDPVIKTRSSFSVEIDLAQDPNIIQQEIEVFGPGDIIGLNPESIVRTEPKINATDFEYNYMPFIEFYDEDLPWRYTPVNPDGTQPNRLRPWMTLIALKKEEFDWRPEATPLPLVHIKQDVLDLDPAETWAWAHVQVNTELDDSIPLNEALKQVVNANPDHAVSRIVCPRKLEPSTEYFLFLVPTFELGRKAGLEEDISTTPLQEPAWVKKITNHDLPYYYHWKFTTSDSSDFEFLASKLHAAPISFSEVRQVDIRSMYEELNVPFSNVPKTHVSLNDMVLTPQLRSLGGVTAMPHQNANINAVNGSSTWKMACALMPANQQSSFFGDHNFTNALLREALRKRINEQVNFKSTPQVDQAHSTEDPIYNTPPLYGQWLAARENLNQLSGDLADEGWIEQLNLDPAYRIAAMLGTKIIRENQDKFMQRAWEQVGEINSINEKISNSQLGSDLNERLFARNVANRSDNDILAATLSLQNKTPLDDTSSEETISQKVFGSKLSNASLDPALIRLTAARSRVSKKMSKQIPGADLLNKDLVKNIANETQGSAHYSTTAASAEPEDPTVMLNNVSAGIIGGTTNPTMSSDAIQNWSVKVIDQALLKQDVDTGIPEFSGGDISQSKASLVDYMAPKSNVKKSIAEKINFATNLQTTALPNTDELKQILAYPEFKDPVFKYLADKFPRFIAPGIENMENNSVSLMKVNQSFIESFLLGMNQAFAEELLWREYPTDQRGSYFKNFWESQDYIDWNGVVTDLDDIQNIDAWSENSSIGSHGVTGIDEAEHGAQGEKVVVMARGELFNKFPDLVIYAHKAAWKKTGGPPQRVLADLGANPDLVIKSPIFKVNLENDIASFGFNMGVNEARGGMTPHGNPDPLSDDPGWFFILKERAGTLRFGLDIPMGGGLPMSSKTADQLDWDDAIAPGLSQQFITVPNPISIADAIWGGDAAEMAYILQQKPSLIAFHASALI